MSGRKHPHDRKAREEHPTDHPPDSPELVDQSKPTQPTKSTPGPEPEPKPPTLADRVRAKVLVDLGARIGRARDHLKAQATSYADGRLSFVDFLFSVGEIEGRLAADEADYELASSGSNPLDSPSSPPRLSAVLGRLDALTPDDVASPNTAEGR